VPTIKITDQLSNTIDVTPNSDSALIKYFKNLSDLSISGAAMALRKGLKLDDPAVTSINSGLTFAQPVDLGASQVDLKIGAGINGFIGISKSGGSTTKLFDPDPYEDPVPVPADSRYVAIGFTSSVSANLGTRSGDLKFGFAAGATVTVTNYRLFATKPTAPDLVDAVASTLGSFVLPADIEDLQALAIGAVVTLNGAGSLKFSATTNLMAAVNPLASASLPAPLPAVALKGGGSISVGASVQLTGEYQIRVSKVDQNLVRLAYYRKTGTAFSVKATASAGISGTVSDEDVLGKLLSAISSDPQADSDELKKADLPSDQIVGINEAIKASISRTVEIALAAELARSDQRAAAFVYEVDLSSLSAESRAAIHFALDGDLSALTNRNSPLPGVRPIKDVFTNIREGKHSLTINLLGIVNYGWISKLVLSGKTVYDPATGQLVISDTATASRFSTATLNIGVADSEKLRHVMAENFLITVAYRGARAAGLQPSLTTSHCFFALNEHTSQETIRAELDVVFALKLMDSGSPSEIAKTAPEFGRTLFYATTHYDNPLSVALFLDGNEPRSVEFYESAGLEAVAALVHKGDFDEARLLPTSNPQLWKEMKELGQPTIHTLFPPNTPAPVVGAIISDYTVIRWWSDSMRSTAEKLAEINDFLATHPVADDENNDFKRLRGSLADHLRSVAANTKEDFGAMGAACHVYRVWTGSWSQSHFDWTQPVHDA